MSIFLTVWKPEVGAKWPVFNLYKLVLCEVTDVDTLLLQMQYSVVMKSGVKLRLLTVGQLAISHQVHIS